ncbi:MAG: hypothetical protein M3295_09270, partial [Chloroflexota bacterium]|nr:hypothetical protein [Chloroflexota bacterium]
AAGRSLGEMAARAITVATVLGVVAVAGAATVDALRGDTQRHEVTSRPVRTEAAPREATPDELAAARISGVLLYSDPSDCALRAVRLPALEPAEAPTSGIPGTCAFSASLDGNAVFPNGSAWRPDGNLVAVPAGGGVDVLAPGTSWGRHFPNAAAPAFRPDDSLTFVRRTRLVAWSRCHPNRAAVVFREPRPVRRCPHVVTSEERLTAGLHRLAVPPGGRVAVQELVWLGPSAFAAVVTARRFGTVDALVVVRGGRVLGPLVATEDVSGLSVSPGGRFFAVLSRGSLLVFARDGRNLFDATARSAAWSPDGRRLAVSDGRFVSFRRLPSGRPAARPIRLAARDIAWR